MNEVKEVHWTKDDMIEVSLKEPDDFLKVRETLTRIGVASRKEKSYISLAIFCTRKVSITLYTSKNYLRLMERKQIFLRTMFSVGIESSNYCLTGVL